jgi:SEC-C motif/HNH endonuclease
VSSQDASPPGSDEHLPPAHGGGGGVRRCWYCLRSKPLTEFKTVEHIMPGALGGNWKTEDVCNGCQADANTVADRLVNNDFLVVFLRARYQIGNSAYKMPPPPRFDAPLSGAHGKVQVTVKNDGTTLTGKMSNETATLLGLSGVTEDDQDRLRELVGDDVRQRLDDPHELARARQVERTPPEAWSRFMAKLGLACGRTAYGEKWMDGRHAQLLSADLLGENPPKLSAQREHVPPVAQAWPYLPPNHNLWIADFEDVAMLHVVLFGQLLGMVPINTAGADAEFSGWRFDPVKRTVNHTTHEGMWAGTAAARATQSGRNVMTIIGTDGQPYTYVEDGPHGPMDIPGQTFRAESGADALRVIAELGGIRADPHVERTGQEAAACSATAQPGRRARADRVGRNDPCPCGSGAKYKRCCGR